MIEEHGTAESGGDGHAVPAHRQTVYRLLPRTRKNWRLLERVLEGQRQLYNAALQERSDAWRLAGRSISYVDQTKALTVCRRDLPEMAAVPVAIQRGTLRRVDEAFKGFFRRVRAREGAVGYPRFRSRRRFDSITVLSGVKLEAGPRGTSGGRLRLPGFGWLTIRRRGGNSACAGPPGLGRAEARGRQVVCHCLFPGPGSPPEHVRGFCGQRGRARRRHERRADCGERWPVVPRSGHAPPGGPGEASFPEAGAPEARLRAAGSARAGALRRPVGA